MTNDNLQKPKEKDHFKGVHHEKRETMDQFNTSNNDGADTDAGWCVG